MNQFDPNSNRNGQNGQNGNQNGENNPQGNGGPPKKQSLFFVLIASLVLLLAMSYFMKLMNGAGTKEISYNEFIAMLEAGEVEEVLIGDDQINITKIESDTTYYTGKAEEDSEITARILAINPEIKVDRTIPDQTNWLLSFILTYILPLLLFWILISFLFRKLSKGGGMMSVGKSNAKVYVQKETGITFKDVAGEDEAKESLIEVVDFLHNPAKYTEIGAKLPKGVLLVGPPGTGKTLLAKAVAGEANVPFFSISGSDFVEMFVGVGASRVRDLFRQAKEKSPCIVFIDEIDAVGRARSKNGGFSSNDERENTLNQLLTEMDGFGSNSGVIILAATNRADILDKALMRAGRFDRQIHVELPDLKEREEIFQVHLRGLKLADDFDVEFLAKHTPGFSGADIANVCNEAALTAARHDKKAIDKQDFLDAVDRIIGGLERKSKIITPQEKKSIAHHEAGHATVSWLLPHANPLFKVTIVPRGQALGAAWYLPEERQLVTREQMIDEMCSLVAGRVAEEMVNGQPSTGALNDLERLTKMAYGMVTYYGMSDKIGNMSFYDSTGARAYDLTRPYSEKTAELIDKEVKELIEMIHDKTRTILEENNERFLALAALLLEKEVIFADDLERIFGPRAGAQPGEELPKDPEELATEE